MSHMLAALWGFTFVLVSFLLLIKPHLLQKLFAEMKHTTIMFLCGLSTLIIGAGMVIIHNVWVLDWRILITILGWLTLLKGFDLLFFPNRMKKRWIKMKRWQWMFLFTLLLLGGVVLLYLGFVTESI